MINNNIRHQLLVAVSGLLLFWCVNAVSAQDNPASDSGFIEEMPAMVQDKERPGAMTWEKPGFNRSAYSGVMIEPITVYLSPDSKSKGLKADEITALSDGFIQSITETLKPEISVVDQFGSGVIYMRAALIDVKMANKKRGLLGYTPVGLVVTSAMNAAGARVILKDATLAIELLDSESGERLAVLIDKAPNVDAELSWESIQNTFNYYSNRFKSRMQAE